MAVGFIAVVQVAAAVGSVRHPGVSLWFSLLVVLYMLLIDAVSFGFTRAIRLAPDLS